MLKILPGQVHTEYKYGNEIDTPPAGYCMVYPIPNWGVLCQPGIVGAAVGYSAVNMSCKRFGGICQTW
jgi:hypothetical protein